MSLVKLDSKNEIRESWWNRKSIKRLETILIKCRRNYNILHNTIHILKSHNLPIDESIENLYDSWVLRAALLDNIIFRRKYIK